MIDNDRKGIFSESYRPLVTESIGFVAIKM